MKYALLGDLHSSLSDTKDVLMHITKISPEAKLVGIGDIFECVIGKKRAITERFESLSKVMKNSKAFTSLLTFPSVRGNQEQRILDITITNDKFYYVLKNLPETIDLPHGIIIHGHQWKEKISIPKIFNTEDKILFYGHSHKSGLMERHKQIPYFHNQEIKLQHFQYQVNVGSVVDNREWLLYDDERMTISFMKARKRTHESN
ncbi:metallophosphoesterase family protein [Paenisporosarcina antarctica]|uniref:Metallophosphoesterase n=1 Tax=Paenisporosarcina antarctica TaxID=417367 RepID=A0A4P6ZYC9_9BACL|nr:metallophosphoesterase family protein [Paenisporosarcina antarctica]QBP41198.1 metallophosphoesterase [Paenisporosarcina antarctica]